MDRVFLPIIVDDKSFKLWEGVHVLLTGAPVKIPLLDLLNAYYDASKQKKDG